MAYTDKTFFLTKIKQTELDELIKDSSGTPQDSYLEEAVKSADDLIDSYLRNITDDLPLSPVPDLIKLLSYNIASYIMSERLNNENTSYWVTAKFSNSLKILQDISERNLDLGIPAEQITWFDSSAEIFGRGSY